MPLKPTKFISNPSTLKPDRGLYCCTLKLIFSIQLSTFPLTIIPVNHVHTKLLKVNDSDISSVTQCMS